MSGPGPPTTGDGSAHVEWGVDAVDTNHPTLRRPRGAPGGRRWDDEAPPSQTPASGAARRVEASVPSSRSSSGPRTCDGGVPSTRTAGLRSRMRVGFEEDFRRARGRMGEWRRPSEGLVGSLAPRDRRGPRSAERLRVERRASPGSRASSARSTGSSLHSTGSTRGRGVSCRARRSTQAEYQMRPKTCHLLTNRIEQRPEGRRPARRPPPSAA